MTIGRIKFEDILGENGKNYDEWLDNQDKGYYLTYKQNFYSDEFDFSIEREGCGASEPVLLAKTIEEITNKIDKEILKSKELIVKYIGIDDWNRPVYKDKHGSLYKDTNLGMGERNLCTSYNNDFYGEPFIPLRDDIKIKIVKEFSKNKNER